MSEKKKVDIKWGKPLVPVVSAEELDADGSTLLIYPEPDPDKINLFVPTIVEKIIHDLQLGLTLHDAAIRTGVKPTTVFGWYKRNHGNFRNAANKAVIDNKAIHLSRITKADSMVKVRASAWILEKKHKGEFGREATLNHNVKTEDEQVFKFGEQEFKF